MIKLPKEKLPELWPLLAAEMEVYLPVEAEGVVNFAPWKEEAEVRLDVANTVVSPKGLLFPCSETYLQFSGVPEELELQEVPPRAESGVIFGIRPCDVRAVELLDLLFQQEPADPLYQARRDALALVALGCNNPDATCFCSAFGLEPGKAPGADLLLTDLGREYLLSPQSTKGEALAGKIKPLCRQAEKEDENKAQAMRQEALSAQQHGLRTEGLKEILDNKFDWEFWDNASRRCLGCGTCTFLCPTCHCFDVQDYSRGERGQRFRCWDSCMFGEFTIHASGHNPRPTQKERVRQRFMHKLNYFPDNFGAYACVGCGRCVRKCPVGLDITQVIMAAGGVKDGCC